MHTTHNNSGDNNSGDSQFREFPNGLAQEVGLGVSSQQFPRIHGVSGQQFPRTHGASSLSPSTQVQYLVASIQASTHRAVEVDSLAQVVNPSPSHPSRYPNSPNRCPNSPSNRSVAA